VPWFFERTVTAPCLNQSQENLPLRIKLQVAIKSNVQLLYAYRRWRTHKAHLKQ